MTNETSKAFYALFNAHKKCGELAKEGADYLAIRQAELDCIEAEGRYFIAYDKERESLLARAAKR